MFRASQKLYISNISNFFREWHTWWWYVWYVHIFLKIFRIFSLLSGLLYIPPISVIIKNFKRIWTIIRREQAIDSTQKQKQFNRPKGNCSSDSRAVVSCNCPSQTKRSKAEKQKMNTLSNSCKAKSNHNGQCPIDKKTDNW